MADEKPYLVIEATYKEGEKDNIAVRAIDSNIGPREDVLFQQMYGHLREGAKSILANTRKGRLELKLTFFD